ACVWIDTDVESGADSQLDPGVVISGPSRLGEGVHVKAHTGIEAGGREGGVHVRAHTVIESRVLEDDVVIGPSAHLRPGTRLRRGVRIGNFVEVKNSDVGAGATAEHLTDTRDADD